MGRLAIRPTTGVMILSDSSTSIPAARSTDPVTTFARRVVAGKVIACKLVGKAAERHLRDLAEGGARGLRFDRAAAEYAINFFGFLRHNKGELAGRVVTLEPWERFAIGSIFGSG